MCSQEDVDRHDLHVKEWGLVYSPVNKQLAELMNETARLLQLEDGAIAVNTSADVEAVMFNRELVAGIEFDLPAVIYDVNFHIHFFFKLNSINLLKHFIFDL